LVLRFGNRGSSVRNIPNTPLESRVIPESQCFRYLHKKGILKMIMTGSREVVDLYPLFSSSVISKVDGFKDYDTIVITKNLTKILSLSPNPNSGGIIAVKYETCSSDELVFEVYSVQNAMKVFSQKSSVNSRKVQKLDIGAIPSGIYVLYIKENGVVLDHIYFVIK